MITDYLEGGLKMIDLASFNKSLEATWIKRVSRYKNCGSWKLKSFFYSEVEKYLYLNIKDSRVIITVSNPFFQEILENCSEVTPIMRKMLYLS